MIASTADIPQLAQLWYLEKAKTCYGGMDVEWSVELCAVHLEEVLQDTSSLVTLEKQGTKIVAACGSSLLKPIIPPYPLTVVEWMWYGTDKKAVVRTWQECMSWGKSKGATYANYTLNQAQANPKKWIEVHQWRKL